MKKSITPLELAQKYLEKLGMDKQDAQILLLPSLFKDNILFTSMKTHNLVTKNKALDKYTQTHIHIAKSFWTELYSQSQIDDYKSSHSNNYEEKQSILTIEANIAAQLVRRSEHISPSVDEYTASSSYNIKSFDFKEASTNKHFATQGGSDQVHIGLHDNPVFKDFRHGILLYDYMLLLKYANKNSLLAISIPAEFCDKYNIIYPKKINRTISPSKQKDQKRYQLEDSNYTNNTNEYTSEGEKTPSKPLPPQKGATRNSSDTPKFTGKPSRGKGALEKAKYKCEWNPAHESFISEKTSKPYMEPHHLIPISKQYLYKYDIDITSNLICLCPNCHKMIHHGKKDEVEKMLRYFHKSRVSALKKCGISLSIETLLAHYDVF